MSEKVITSRELLNDVRKLVDMIMGEADKKEIDSLAFWIGHHQDILNPHNAEIAQPPSDHRTEYATPA